jgi:glucosamine kinase
MSDALVVGLDIGATATRAAVASVTGQRLGTGRGGGGNPTSRGAQVAAGQLRLALSTALATVDPSRVLAAAMGLAGGARLLADPASRTAFDAVWREAGLRCPYTVISDALVAYASGTPAPDGTVLIAGTGAIAAQVRALRLDRVADGHGWLLGDAGSGFWLGREAVRRTLADLDAGRAPTGVSDLVLNALLGSAPPGPPGRATVDALVQAVNRRPPIDLAALAPLVMRAIENGDPRAADIVGDAARLLVETAARIRPAGQATPIVLGGGLLTAPTPLAAAVNEACRTRWPDAPRVRAGDGAAAAAWLAARALPEVADPVALHRTLIPR